MDIKMVDLKTQYLRLKTEIDIAIQQCIDSSRFIGGPVVQDFEKTLGSYLNAKEVISCANGTDALQIALMALDLDYGDEILVPAFTYAATAEVIGLLGLKPVMVDVNEDDFNMNVSHLKEAITSRTKAIIPVHLYGQCSDMDAIMNIAAYHSLFVIEDNAQSIGGTHVSGNKTGTIGHMGCTSFFPSKNLGCYGDGGAVYTNNAELGKRIRMIARHGQSKKYYHEVIGVNSRLDSIQAGILCVKLNQLDDFIRRRQNVAEYYNLALGGIDELTIPYRSSFSDHVFHQYTIKVGNGKRDELKDYLASEGIPSMIYYPIPLYKQNAFSKYHDGNSLPVTELLCSQVLSLPIHTEMKEAHQEKICHHIQKFFA